MASIAQTKRVADQVNRIGVFDAVIHNAAVGNREPKRLVTEDGLPHVFAINTLAPYLLSALIHRPKRLVYLSSGLHQSGDITLHDLAWEMRPWSGIQAYSDTKLHDVLLAFAIARLWPDVLSNALEPGSGQRLGDIATLRWNNIDLAHGKLRFSTRKTGKTMILPLAEPLRKYIESLSTPGAPSAPLHPKAFDLLERHHGNNLEKAV